MHRSYVKTYKEPYGQKVSSGYQQTGCIIHNQPHNERNSEESKKKLIRRQSYEKQINNAIFE